MKREFLYAALAAGAIAFGAAGAFAHGGATGIVKERMDLMDGIGKAMKSLTAMMRGKESYDMELVRSLARKIAEHGGETMTNLFPEGSLQESSEALPAVWTDWGRFSGLAEQLSTYSMALEAAAGNERAAAGGGAMMGDGAMMGGGMGEGSGMMGSGAGMMMGDSQAAPTAEQLSTMPPDAAFMHVAQTCSACHQDFRKEKSK